MSALSQTNEKLSEHLEEAGDKVRRVHEATASVIFGQDRVRELVLEPSAGLGRLYLALRRGGFDGPVTLAEQSTDELEEIEGIDTEFAGKLTMKASEPWFAEAEAEQG